jgi:S-adenosylmethionine:tRNA ribosyltransferase-isomerase
MKTEDFNYDLPQRLIAQTPVYPRHTSRLMVLNRQDDTFTHANFWDFAQFLKPGDCLVINETRVIPARIFALKKPGGGKVELLLLKKNDALIWRALVGGKGLTAGRELVVIDGPEAKVIEELDGAERLIRFSEPIEGFFDAAGHVPLPPYIHEKLDDPERYQTVYARDPGSAAAPTAGLHFTPELMEKLEKEGVLFERLTLHVGLDTFAPVTEENPGDHIIHTEWCELNNQTAQGINAAKKAGGRIIAVGTTSVRTLETAAKGAFEGDVVAPFQGPTNLYILPGYQFSAVDALVTNFHLPKSTLLMLVSAFAGQERIFNAYQEAINMNYRFFSFGDAMFIQ